MKTQVISMLAVFLLVIQAPVYSVEGWLSWRGPEQNGTSPETGLPDQAAVGGENHLWTFDMPGRGTPVTANGKVYLFGYDGEGPDLQEFLVCLDEQTGKEEWRLGYNDYLSDNVYNRYSIGSPVVDGETGNIYLLTTPGTFVCVTPEGKELWRHSMMEAFGRLTFPNGRTGAPVIDGDLAIVQGITSNWGSEGPAQNRFYAFDKKNGQLVWSSSPGIQPKDSSFSTPVFAWQGGKRVFYSGTGCGNVVCVNARTGEPIWRYQISLGGVNSSVLIHNNDKLIAIHGQENVDSSETGRMVAIKLGAEPDENAQGLKVLDKSWELWRNNQLCMFTSSPVLVGDTVYQVVQTGELFSIDAVTGKVNWVKKLATDQLHASPLYADGKLYVPMQNGIFYILKPGEKDVETLCQIQLEGNALGSPAVWNGKIFVHTTEKLYCFGKPQGSNLPTFPAETFRAPEGAAAKRLQISPVEVLMHPGQQQEFAIRSIDENGMPVGAVDKVKWEKYIPPTAKVKAMMDAEFNEEGILIAKKDAKLSAGAYKATSPDGSIGTIRGRLLPDFPIEEGFEEFSLTESTPNDPTRHFAFPPLAWIGARFKWEVEERDGNKVLAKTLDNVLFQRAMTFIGSPEQRNYTIEADVMSDGNRRMMSNVGVINQRYVIALIGNWQQLEVSSNYNRIHVNVPYKWKPNTWYRIKSRVDVRDDGSGIVRGKVWPRGETEPAEWTIEAPHAIAHAHGSPGLFGFSPQSQFKVYIDNVSVYSNED